MRSTVVWLPQNCLAHTCGVGCWLGHDGLSGLLSTDDLTCAPTSHARLPPPPQALAAGAHLTQPGTPWAWEAAEACAWAAPGALAAWDIKNAQTKVGA